MRAKEVKIIALVMAAIVLLALGGYIVYAQKDSTYPSIVQRLAERFNLDAAEVNKVFEEHREERHQEHMERFEERLDKAVADGTITEEQKEAILEKKDELRKRHEELKNLPAEERREAWKSLKEDLKKWADEQNIDLRLFFRLCKEHDKGRPGGGHMRGHWGGPMHGARPEPSTATPL